MHSIFFMKDLFFFDHLIKTISKHFIYISLPIQASLYALFYLIYSMECAGWTLVSQDLMYDLTGYHWNVGSTFQFYWMTWTGLCLIMYVYLCISLFLSISLSGRNCCDFTSIIHIQQHDLTCHVVHITSLASVHCSA